MTISPSDTRRIIVAAGNSLVNFNLRFRYHHWPFATEANSRTAPTDVTQSYDNPDAIVVLPALRGHLRDAGLRRWLSRSMLDALPARTDRLALVLESLGRHVPTEGLGALRMWGQTGDRPTVWIAAADPVYLEPRLDHLFLHVLKDGDVTITELRRLVDHLQATLGEDHGAGFARLGDRVYLRSVEPFPTSMLPASRLDQEIPDPHMPAGPDADGYRRVVSEIEMALHDHPVNRERQARGQRPVNSLWLWGGGLATQGATIPLPPLFADDPLLQGYWRSVDVPSAGWPGSIAACLDEVGSGFVAVLPGHGAADEQVDLTLREMRQAVDSGRIDRLLVLAEDGLQVAVRRRDRYRFWRRESQLLRGPGR
jgi:hypothetical protein